MTKTALRALIVSALSAAVLSVASPALAQTAAPLGAPAAAECLPGEEFQYGFGCVAVQLPSETQGRQTDVVVPATPSVNSCFRQDPECASAPAHKTFRPAPPRPVRHAAAATAVRVAPKQVGAVRWTPGTPKIIRPLIVSPANQRVLGEMIAFDTMVKRVQLARAS